MDFTAFFDKAFFSIGDHSVSVGASILFVILLTVLFIVWQYFNRKIFPLLPGETKEDLRLATNIRRFIFISFALIVAIDIVHIFDLNAIIYQNEEGREEGVVLKVSSILIAALVIFMARLIDWGITDILAIRWRNRKDSEGRLLPSRQLGIRNNIVQPFIYTLAIFFIVHAFSLNFTFFTYIRNGVKLEFRLSNVIAAVLIILGSRILTWMITNLVLAFYFSKEKQNIGSQYAANQLVKYFVFTLALLFAIQTLGINLTLIWGGAAALLVGVGLGLQQLFHDLSCGFILLFERTVEVGDVLELPDMFGEVKKIGLRTSIIETNNNISVIIPNSKLVSDAVVNWSHYVPKARFHLTIGVAYGSDATFVKEILEKVAEDYSGIRKSPKPFVRFKDFGDSALIFELHFWVTKLLNIENIKSDLRFAIYQVFNENNIEIPFPQRDVWIKGGANPDC